LQLKLFCLDIFIVQDALARTHTSAAMSELLSQECWRSRTK